MHYNRIIIAALLVITGIIHLMPTIGILGSEKLTSLYGLNFDEPNLAILMRHRAVLFGLLGAFLVLAAFKPKLQLIAITAGYISVVSFLILAWLSPSYNLSIKKIVIADIIALVCLVGTTILYLLNNKK
ncbi:MAG: phosphopantetheine adenylyltransferase [Gammaproteobacteria bacterium]|nr:phosphopantetheine adenylyltransferase [Gammaproteobacteria bacterium]